MRTTVDLQAKDRQHLWHPFTQQRSWCEEEPPLVIDHAEGTNIYDTDGNVLWTRSESGNFAQDVKVDAAGNAYVIGVNGGRAHVYKPLVPAEKARRQHLRDLVERLFGGNSEELVVGLLEDEQLSKQDLERLRAAIDEKLEPRGKGKKP